MKTHLGLILSLIALSIGTTAAQATELVRVQSSRNLRVVVIDASKPGVSRSAVHETFAASLASSLQRQGGTALPVKLTEETDAAKAVADLTAGVYDAALFFEGSLPGAVRQPEFAVKRGVSEVGVPVRVFHLALRNDDPAMVSVVTAAFGETIKTARFQEALSRSVEIRVIASNSR